MTVGSLIRFGMADVPKLPPNSSSGSCHPCRGTPAVSSAAPLQVSRRALLLGGSASLLGCVPKVSSNGPGRTAQQARTASHQRYRQCLGWLPQRHHAFLLLKPLGSSGSWATGNALARELADDHGHGLRGLLLILDDLAISNELNKLGPSFAVRSHRPLLATYEGGRTLTAHILQAATPIRDSLAKTLTQTAVRQHVEGSTPIFEHRTANTASGAPAIVFSAICRGDVLVSAVSLQDARVLVRHAQGARPNPPPPGANLDRLATSDAAIAGLRLLREDVVSEGGFDDRHEGTITWAIRPAGTGLSAEVHYRSEDARSLEKFRAMMTRAGLARLNPTVRTQRQSTTIKYRDAHITDASLMLLTTLDSLAGVSFAGL